MEYVIESWKSWVGVDPYGKYPGGVLSLVAGIFLKLLYQQSQGDTKSIIEMDYGSSMTATVGNRHCKNEQLSAGTFKFNNNFLILNRQSIIW